VIATAVHQSASGVAEHLIPLAGFGLVAFLIGRKWRRQYQGALDFKAELVNKVELLTAQNLALSAAINQSVHVQVGGSHVGDELGLVGAESIAGASRGLGVRDDRALCPSCLSGVLGIQEVANLPGSSSSPPTILGGGEAVGALLPREVGSAPAALSVGSSNGKADSGNEGVDS